MTTIPKAAIDAAVSSYMGSMRREGFIAHEDIPAAFEGAILAALPHLGEIDRIRKNLSTKLVASTSAAWAATGVPLYLAPPATVADVTQSDPIKTQMAEALVAAQSVLSTLATNGRKYGPVYSHAMTALHMIAPALAAYKKEA